MAGAVPPCPRLTSSRHWAAACGGQSRDREPEGPWGSPPPPTLVTQHPPELGLLEPVRTRDLSVHLVQLPGKRGWALRLRPWVGLDPEPPGPRGPLSLVPLRKHLRGPQGDPTPGAHPGSTAAPPTPWLTSRLTPTPGQAAALRSPPPPGAAGHTLGFPASAGSRCKGGRGAGTARRALGAGRDAGGQPLARRAP